MPVADVSARRCAATLRARRISDPPINAAAKRDKCPLGTDGTSGTSLTFRLTDMRETVEIPKIDRGQYLIVRADGREDLIDATPTLGAIYKAIGCDCVDTVTLDHKKQTVMLVDDEAAIRDPLKPINEKATALYHSRCKLGTTWSIRGDVAIVNDEDFA